MTENTENVLVKRSPQRLIIGKPISQYASHSAMFCPLYSNITKNSMKSISAIYPTITENTENVLVKCASHISICEKLNFSNVELDSLHSKQGIAREMPQQSLCLVLKPLRVYYKSSPYAVVKKSMGGQRGTKVTL